MYVLGEGSIRGGPFCKQKKNLCVLFVHRLALGQTLLQAGATVDEALGHLTRAQIVCQNIAPSVALEANVAAAGAQVEHGRPQRAKQLLRQALAIADRCGEDAVHTCGRACYLPCFVWIFVWGCRLGDASASAQVRIKLSEVLLLTAHRREALSVLAEGFATVSSGERAGDRVTSIQYLLQRTQVLLQGGSSDDMVRTYTGGRT